MNIQKQLKNIGLHNSEIEVYLYLLEQGISTPPQISKGTKIARTNCYNILASLKEKDLVKEQKKRKRKVYLANDPEALVRNLDKKREAAKSMLPDLRAMYKSQKNKPVIHFFDGFEQIKEIYYQTLSAEIIRGIASTKQLFSLSPDFFENYRKKIKEKGIIFRDIVTHDSSEESVDEAKKILGALNEVQTLPEEYKDMPTDILIWEDSIALITTVEPIFGTVIKNDYLAKTFTIIFDVLWKKL